MRAVIFDIDGTLLDSVDLHARAWVEAFAHFGIAAEVAAVRSQIGKGGDQLMPLFVPQARLDTEGPEIEAYRSDLFKRDYLPKVQPFPQVRELFLRLRADGRAIALASSGKAEEVARYQEIADIADLVDVATSSDDAERSKPHPDIFEAARRKLGPEKAQAAVIVGDSPFDAEAGVKAGLPVVGLLCGGFPEAALTQAGCIAIYRDPADLLEDYAGSPLVRPAR